MRGKLAEQVNATIYQYQLIRKISLYKEFRWSHGGAALLFSGFVLAMYRTQGALALPAAFFFTHALHLVILRLTLVRVEQPDHKRWRWELNPPWIGYMPTAHIEMGLWRKLHRHLLWVGLCIIAIVYPWVNEAQMISLIVMHLWTLIPRLVIVWLLRGAKSNGVLRIQGDEIGFYHR